MALDTFKAQQLLHATLVNAGICGGRIFDAPPDSPSDDDGKGSRNYPYCVIDDSIEEPADTAAKQRIVLYQTLQVWTRYRGKAKARELADSIRTVLHAKSFTTSDGNALRIVWENTQVFHDADGRSYRAVLRLRMTLEGDCA